jgi:hypothetical protein
MSPAVHRSASPRSPARVCQIRRLAAIWPRPACRGMWHITHLCRNPCSPKLGKIRLGCCCMIEPAELLERRGGWLRNSTLILEPQITIPTPVSIVLNCDCRSLESIVVTGRPSVWCTYVDISSMVHLHRFLSSPLKCRAVDTIDEQQKAKHVYGERGKARTRRERKAAHVAHRKPSNSGMYMGGELITYIVLKTGN